MNNAISDTPIYINYHCYIRTIIKIAYRNIVYIFSAPIIDMC